jgi:hypothetical protein
MASKTVRLPPGCGDDLNEPLLHNPYQADFQRARRMRFCLNCRTMGSMNENSVFVCKKCEKKHESNLTAPRAYDRFLLLAGRGSGKTLIGAHAAREEMLVPNSIGWVMGATYKILHDSTFPTLVRRIPPHWVKRWDPEHMEITLINNALVAFRSLDDPERARGPHGVGWGWLDEAALAAERAYNVFEPTLLKAGGILIATTTPAGFDWTYEKLEQQAKQFKEPGYYFRTWWSEHNPIFRSNPAAMRKLEQHKRTWSPELFGQEYRAERRNATGLIYDYTLIESLVLRDDDAIRAYIPEWPKINANRPRLIGLDSGADHPFGAVQIIVTEKGLVVVGEYLERKKAISQHLDPINMKFGMPSMLQNVKWAANKNEANLRLEWGLRGIGVIPAEAKHEIGIQRVQSWLYAKEIHFSYTVPGVIAQMQAYRYADNITTDEQKKKEQVFKQKDEYPDCIRYALMAWPELPERAEPMPEREKARWDNMDETAREQVLQMREYNKRQEEKNLDEGSEHYPLGEFFGTGQGQDEVGSIFGY